MQNRQNAQWIRVSRRIVPQTPQPLPFSHSRAKQILRKLMRSKVVRAVPACCQNPRDGRTLRQTHMTTCRHPPFVLSLVLAGIVLPSLGSSFAAAAAGESPKDVLAAQIRSQGVVCDNPQRAVRDARRSKPDHDVWVLTCENATYRVSRYPDLAAKVERIR
jgi:hypothetical protein